MIAQTGLGIPAAGKVDAHYLYDFGISTILHHLWSEWEFECDLNAIETLSRDDLDANACYDFSAVVLKTVALE